MKDPSEMRLFCGGPFHGECRAVGKFSLGITIPILDRNGKTLNPPKWAAYRLRGDDMVHLGDGDDVCFAIGLELPAPRKDSTP